MGTLQPIVKYPLDLTGKSPDNLISDEIHTLLPGVNRSLIPKYGAFYTTFNMGLRDMATGQILVPETQYKPILYYAAASERSGKEVCAGVIVTDPTVSDQVAFTYQVVGGEYTHLTNIILELIENLELDNREVLWGDLLGKPNFFTPAMHLHDVGDIYGFEYIVEAIYRLRDAILVGDEASHEHIFQLIDALRELVVANHDRIMFLIDIAAGSDTVGALAYNGTTRAAGKLYGGTANPISTTRLNYDGHFHATSFTATGDIKAGGRVSVGSDGLLPRLREHNGQLEAVIDGVWRVVWPPQWQ